MPSSLMFCRILKQNKFEWFKLFDKSLANNFALRSGKPGLSPVFNSVYRCSKTQFRDAYMFPDR